MEPTEQSATPVSFVNPASTTQDPAIVFMDSTVRAVQITLEGVLLADNNDHRDGSLPRSYTSFTVHQGLTVAYEAYTGFQSPLQAAALTGGLQSLHGDILPNCNTAKLYVYLPDENRLQNIPRETLFEALYVAIRSGDDAVRALLGQYEEVSVNPATRIGKAKATIYFKAVPEVQYDPPVPTHANHPPDTSSMPTQGTSEAVIVQFQCGPR